MPSPDLRLSPLTASVAWTAVLAVGLVFPAAAPAQTAKPLPRLTTEVAFPNLHFNRPVVMAYPKDGSNLLFVVEQHTAKIFSFPNQRDAAAKDTVEFLSLPDPINRGNEEGLLGLAFHPKYKENGQFFVYYSANDKKKDGVDRRSVVSRFRVSKETGKADPSSEERVWVSAKDPFENHNGGCIEFGPDGFLYISLGDSGAGGDPLSTGQKPEDWFGSILRIDIDHPSGGKPYGIPADNPALRSKELANWAPEVYCIGLRNVWKFTFDRETGTLWAGDVGQNLYEMVHIIRNGGNYGWSIKEAFHPFEPQRRQRVAKGTRLSPPLVEYPHAPTQERPDDGKSITGGYVYRGKAIPDLVGVYVYGDYDTGRIWGLREKNGKAVLNRQLIDVRKQKRHNIAAFGEDPAGELYILDFNGGQIHRFVPAGKAGR